MKNSVNKRVSIEAIEAKAVRGEDVTQYFGKNPKVHPGYGKMERIEKKIFNVLMWILHLQCSKN